jgi:hypothetical protein
MRPPMNANFIFLYKKSILKTVLIAFEELILLIKKISNRINSALCTR